MLQPWFVADSWVSLGGCYTYRPNEGLENKIELFTAKSFTDVKSSI